MSLGLTVYRMAATLAQPVVGLALRRRRAAGREDPARLGERLGRAGWDRPAGCLVWVHAASLGEALSVLPLVAALRATPAAPAVLVTTVTTTSAALLAARLPPGALHQYAPVDTPAAVRRFLAHWRPDLAVLVESELWPTLLTEAWRSGVRTALVNGRMSARSERRWRWAPRTAATLLAGLDVCLACSPAQADRLRRLGATQARCVGDLKTAAPLLPAAAAGLAAADLTALRAAAGGRQAGRDAGGLRSAPGWQPAGAGLPAQPGREPGRLGRLARG
ncbi:MAG: 3-deoxy-D-manno-octulosonic acid transferase, partial [Alphaproteobacteria bacterium]